MVGFSWLGYLFKLFMVIMCVTFVLWILCALCGFEHFILFMTYLIVICPLLVELLMGYFWLFTIDYYKLKYMFGNVP